MFERILVPLDGSRFSARALPVAIEIAKKFDAEVILLQVVQPTPVVIPAADAMVSPTATQMVFDAAKAQDKRKTGKANRYLGTKLKEVTEKNVKGSYRTEIGDPAKTIVGFCQKESIDLVVMTTSGKSGLKRTFLGSVADVIIREPGIPVLAIRTAKR